MSTPREPVEPRNDKAAQLLKMGRQRHFSEPPDLLLAEECYRNAASADPDWGEPVYWLATVAEALAKHSEAQRIYAEAMVLMPSDPRPVLALGFSLTRRRKFAEARTWLEKGVAMKPHYGMPDACCTLAETYAELGEIDQAIALWRQVLEMPSEYPSYELPREEAERKLKQSV